MSLHPPLRRCWMKRGQRQQIAAPGSPQFVHVCGGYDWRSGRVWHQTQAHKNSDSFIEFIEYAMTTIPAAQKVIMVLDNASYHRSQASLAALSLFEGRLHIVWLPKYCPFLNVIERFWLHLRSLAAANHLHRSPDDLIQAIDTTVQQQNQPDFPDRLDFAKIFQLTA